MQVVDYLVLTALAAPLFPLLAFFLIGARMLFNARPTDGFVTCVVSLAVSGSVIATGAMAVLFLVLGAAPVSISIAPWFGAGDYSFHSSLLIDPLSVPMAALLAGTCGIVSRFSRTYLIGEPGQPRFFLLFCAFASGMFLLVMAGSLDLLIVGWELVGISSMLLIGFFHEYTGPVRNGLHAFVVYRVCDIGLLLAAVLLGHDAQSSMFLHVIGPEPWPSAESPLRSGATLVSLCLLWAVMGKSALFPLGNWLPRAMEGPTPSSAIFYGSLAVHAGVYLLLRASALLEQAPAARAAVVAIGALSAIHGTLLARVQTDAKSQLACATATQIGLIVVEIGLGLPRLALLHLLGHACLRTWQLLRAPSAISDALQMRSALGGQPRAKGRAASAFERRLYQLALGRFHLDAFWQHAVARPFLYMGAVVERGERSLIALLMGEMDADDPITVSRVEEDGSHRP